MNIKRFLTVRILVLVATLVAILIMITSTKPEDVGMRGVLLFFGLIYLSSYLVIEMLARRRSKGVVNHTVIALLASLPAALLALQSLGQLGSRDLLITVALAIIVVFYWSRFKV